MGNKKQTDARKAKKDEFYTRLEDINNELKNYKNFFKDKIVYCCCDDGEWSNFWKFFYMNFDAFGLKKLIATSFHDGIARNEDETDQAYKYEYEGGFSVKENIKNGCLAGVTKVPLEGNGDYKSDECLAIMDSADVIVTNPPFSLFRDFVDTLEEHNKKYIIWGNTNAVTYKNIFPLIKNNKLWGGYLFNKTCIFQIPNYYDTWDEKETAKINDGYHYCKVPAISVFTNVETNTRHEILKCYSRYDPEKYPKYDNYDAIECKYCTDIPCDYYEEKIITKEELEQLRANGFSVDVLEEIPDEI